MAKGSSKSKRSTKKTKSDISQQMLHDLAQRDAFDLSNQFPLKSTELISFFSTIENLSALDTKLSYSCRYISEVTESQSAFLVLFDGNLNITRSYYNVTDTETQNLLPAFFDEHFSDTSALSSDFFNAIFQPDFQTSFSFLVSPDQLQSIAPFSFLDSRAEYKRITDENAETFPLGHVLFTPLYDPDRLILGFVATDFKQKPENSVKLAALTEFLTEAIEKHIFSDLYNLETRQGIIDSDFSSLTQVTERIIEGNSPELIAKNLSKEITKLGNLKSCTVAFFDHNDQIHAFSHHQRKGSKGQDPCRPFSYSHDGRIEKSICEAIFMIKGFEYETGFCFSAEQLSLLVYALQSGMSPPKEFSENDLARPNLNEYQHNENIGLFIPLHYNKELLGYISLGSPNQFYSLAQLNPIIKKIGFIADKVSDYLWLLKLQTDKENEKRKVVSYQEILSTLVATSSKIHSDAPLNEKLNHVVNAVVEFFGLSYAAICTFDDELTLTHAAHAFHSQSEFLALKSVIERRFKVGRSFSRRLLSSVLSPPFIAEPCYIFKTRQVKRVLDGESLDFEFQQLRAFTGETSKATTLSLQNLNDYLTGDENVGVIIPFYGEQNKLIGLISLGGVLLSGGVYELSEIMDRFYIIAHFAEQISRDYQLSLVEFQRNEEILENQRLNQTVSSLFEIGSKIAETDNLETKLELLCKAISSTGIDTAIACLCDQNGIVNYTKQYFHSHIGSDFVNQLKSQYAVGKTINIEAYDTLFNTSAFKLSPINIYCADLRQLNLELKNHKLSVFGSETQSYVNLENTEHTEPSGYKNLQHYLDYKNKPEQDVYLIATPITSDFSNENTLKGLLLLGNFVENMDYDTVLKRFVVIDLFVRTISADLTNVILTTNLQSESRKLRKKNQFIESLLALNVKLSKPISRFEQIKSVCEQSVKNSDFSYVSAILIDPDSYEITNYLQAENPRLGNGNIELIEHLPENLNVLNKAYLELALDSKHKISQSYCFNNADIMNKLPNEVDQNSLIFSGCRLVPLNEFEPSEQLFLESDLLFETYCLAQHKSQNNCTLLIPIQNQKNEIFGFITLGALIEDISKSKDDVLDEIRIIELLVNSLAGSLENMILTETLARWDAKFRNAAENVEYGMLITDKAGSIEYANQFIKKVLGYSDSEILEKTFLDLVDEKSLAVAKTGYENALDQAIEITEESNAKQEYEIDLVANDGANIPFQVITNGQYFVNSRGDLALEGTFSILVDLRKVREIEKKKREIETIRNNFLAMIVHDMKVPLSAIYGYSDMLKSVNPTTMDPIYFKDIISRVHQSASNINLLVQEILDFSKYESNLVVLNKQSHNLILCIDLVLDQNQLALQKKGMKITRNIDDHDFTFLFDFDKMARAIGNIFSNAIKFSSTESTIEIRLQHQIHNNKPFALVSIKDFGEGIPETEIDLIFDAYQQAQSKHGSRGTGLGLSITKQIIELHGGEIWAESELNKGTIIHFFTPMTD